MRVEPGFRVIHVLLMSKHGLPRGPHEHAMIHVPESLSATSEGWVSEACGMTGAHLAEVWG